MHLFSGTGMQLVSFWEFWEVPGLYFESSGGLLGSIFLDFVGIMLGALGPSWAPWGALGPHKASHGCPESKCDFILKSCSVHFGFIGGQIQLKKTSSYFLDFIVILEACWELVGSYFCRCF